MSAEFIKDNSVINRNIIVPHAAPTAIPRCFISFAAIYPELNDDKAIRIAVNGFIISKGKSFFDKIKEKSSSNKVEIATPATAAFIIVSRTEEKDLSSALQRAADAALSIIERGIPETANRFNGSHP